MEPNWKLPSLNPLDKRRKEEHQQMIASAKEAQYKELFGF
jgi:hypothetical protein